MKIKRKRSFEVPARVQSFINNVTSVPFEDIETPLKGFVWDFEKGDFYHWGKLFNHFGCFFETCIKGRKDLCLEDDFLAAEFPFPKEAVLEILRVVKIILENCSNKHLFTSYEQHLSTLLASCDGDVVEASLHTLSAFLKKTVGKCCVRDTTLISKLLSISQGWGSKEEGLGLIACSLQDGCDSATSNIGSSLHFEFYAEADSQNEGSCASQFTQGLQVIHMINICSHMESDLEILKKFVDEYRVAPNMRFSLLTKLRFARAFGSLHSRQQFVCIRLYAFIILVHARNDTDSLANFFNNEPEFVSELVSLMSFEELIPEKIRILAVLALATLCQDRAHQSAVVASMTSGCHRGILSSLMQKNVDTITGHVTKQSVTFCEALLSLVAVLVSSSPGSTALREAGIVPTLLPLLTDTNPRHLHLVTTAVNVLERFMDYSNPAISLFRELGGLDDTIARLKIEVSAVDKSPKKSGEDSFYNRMDLPVVSSSTILDSPSANFVSQIGYYRKLLIKALLRSISLGIYVPGTTSRVNGAEECLLPQCLCLIFRSAKDFGGGVFSLGATVMSDLLHKDPTCFPALESSGAPQAFLDAIVSGVICSSEAIGCIPLCLDALCLNNNGVQAVKESNALRCFVKVFTCRTYLRALYGDTPGSLSSGLDELLRHVSSLRSSGVEMLIDILNTVINMGGGSDTSLSLESCTSCTVHDGHPSKTSGLISDSSSDGSVMGLELFLPECVSNVCRLLETVLHNADTCHLFIEKKGIEAVLHLFNLPLMPFSPSLGQNIAVAFKVFSPQHSGSLSRTVCSFLKEQIKLTNELLISVHGSKFSDLETSMQTKFCRCFFILDGLLSLLTFLLKGSTSVAPELSSSDSGLVKDLGEVYKEVLWQTSLCCDRKIDEKGSNKKPSATGATLSTTTSREMFNDGSHVFPQVRYRHPLATRNGNMSDWNFSQELFSAVHSSDILHHHSHHGAYRTRGGRTTRHHDVDVEDPINFAETSIVQDARKKSPALLLSDIMLKLGLSIRAFHVSLVKGLMTRRRADQGSLVPVAKNRATALAKLFHEALSYSGHSTADLETSLSVKCIYLGKVVDDMIALLFDSRRRLCNTAVMNSFYSSGTFKELLTTFEATSQLLWTLHSMPFSAAVRGKTDANNLAHSPWLLDTLKSYCQLLGYFANPSLLLSSSASQAELLVQPATAGSSIGLIPVPRDPEVFVRMLQSQVMDAILPIWNHSLFPSCYPTFITSLISIITLVYSVVGDAKHGLNSTFGNASQRFLIPPFNESLIASIVEMGFSRARAEEALRSVSSSSVEMAMDWLFSNPEDHVQEDVQFAQALALSLGNSSETSKDDNIEKMTDLPTEGKMTLPPVDDIISASMKLFQCNDLVIFPLTDLLTTLCYCDKGENRQTVVSYLVGHLKLCSTSFSKDIAGLSHVLALLLTEDPSNREIAAEKGVVSTVLDILTNLSLNNEPREENFLSKCMSALFLILYSMLQCKPKIPEDHVKGTTSGQKSLPLSVEKISQNRQDDDECEKKLDNMFERIFGPSTGHLTAEESLQTLTITCDLLKHNVGTLVMNGILRVCARITRNHALAIQFLENGGLITLFNVPKDCMFPGFESMASAIVRHLLEDPLSLQAAMELEIKQTLMGSLSRHAGRVSPKLFLTTMAPVISRDPVIFMKASAATCQLESSGGRTCIVLRKEKEKEKVKPSGTVHTIVPVSMSETPISLPKSQKKVPAVLYIVINQLAEIIMSYPQSTTNENCGSSSVSEDIDGSKVKNKGKCKVCEINPESKWPSDDSFSIEKMIFSLKLMNDILLLYMHAASVILKCDSETNHLQASGYVDIPAHSGMLSHVIYELLPLSSDGSSEEWKVKVSNNASTFLVTLCGQSAEGRRRVVNELVQAISEMLKNSGDFPTRKLLPNKNIMAFSSLINSILSKCSSSSTSLIPIPGCSPEVARTMIDAGMVKSLTGLLQAIDLDHPSAATTVNYMLKSLEILTRAANITVQISKAGAIDRKKTNDRSEEITDVSPGDDVMNRIQNAGSQPENDPIPSLQLLAQGFSGELAQAGHFEENVEEDMVAQSDENAPGAFAEHSVGFMHEGLNGRDAAQGTNGVRLSFQVERRTDDNMVDDDEEDMGDDGVDVEDDDGDDYEDEDIAEERGGEDRHGNSVGDDDHTDNNDFGQDRVVEVRWRESLDPLDHLRILRDTDNTGGFLEVATEPVQGINANDTFLFQRHLGIERLRQGSRSFNDRVGADSNALQHPLLSRPQTTDPSGSSWDSARVPPRDIRSFSTGNLDASHLRMFDSRFPSISTENTFSANPSRLIDYALGMDPFHVSGRRGLSDWRWTDAVQPQAGRLSATIAQAVEEHFVSQLRRPVPLQSQLGDSFPEKEKCKVSVTEMKSVSTLPIESQICESEENLASGEVSAVGNHQPVLETIPETEIPSIQMQDYPEFHVGSQRSEFTDNLTGTTSRTDSHSSSHANIDSGSTIPDSSDGHMGSAGTSVDIDMNGIDVTGNEGESNVPASSDGAALPSNESTSTDAIDPAFLEALPDDLRAEVLASQQAPSERPARPARPSEFLPPVSREIDPEFLAALPPDIQTEVLAQQRAQRLVLSQQAAGLPVDMDNASIIATFPPELRQEVLLTSSEAVLSSLPSNFLAEAQMLRDRAASHYHAHSRYFTGNHRLGSRRLAVDRGVGVTAGQRALPRLANKLTDEEFQGAPLFDMDGLKALICLLRLSQLGKGLLQRLMLNLCSHSTTRTELICLLLEIIEPYVYSSTSLDSRRLSDFQTNIVFPRSHSIEGLLPVISRRVLEILTYLATNHLSVSSLLVFLELSLDAESLSKFEYKECYKRKAPENFAHDSCQKGLIPLILFLKLLNIPLYLRSNAHLEQVMSLLQVVVNNAVSKIESQSHSTEVAVCEAQKDDGSSHDTKKSSVTYEILVQLPESDLKNLSGLLSHEGLSDKIYSLASEVVKKLASVVEPHFKFFIDELASLAHGLRSSAINELTTLKREGMLGLSISSMAGAGFLRVLQTLSSLNNSHDKNKSQETDFENREESSVWQLHVSLHPLWQELSDCMSMIVLKLGPNLSSAQRLNHGDSGGLSPVSPPLPPGTQRLLPFIEAFFILSEKLHNKNHISQMESNCREVTGTSGSSSLSPLRCAGRTITLARFAEKHRCLLNAYIRQNSNLLENSLSMMLKVPRLIDFDNKRAYFRSKIRQQHDQHLAPIRVSVRRAYVLEDSYNQLRMRSGQELKGRLAIHFQGEEGIDAGGLTREWYQVLSRVIFDKGALLFTTVGNNLTFQPNPNSVYQTEHLSYFKFVGRLVAKAVFDSQLLDVYFTRSFYKHILGVKVTYHDIEAIDPDYYKNLKWMLENDVSEIPDLTFSMDPDEEKHILYEKTEVMDYELKPGGRNIRVTEETKHEYVDLVADHILSTAIRPQINSFLEGFHELIPRELISIFNDKELELLISGLPEIDMDDLQANTEFTGYSVTSCIIQWFWEVVKSFSKEDKARFVQFVTGTSKVPLDGFKALQGVSGPQRFQIHKAYGAPERLPSAHTCFNQLDLPEYLSKDQLQERLLLAIHESSEGFGFG